jgi:chemotaxis response regulator CheB
VKPVRVLAVADASALAGFRHALAPESVELVATAATPQGALAQQRRMYPDVIVLDLALTQTDVFLLLAQLVQEGVAPVLALTSGENPARQAERAFALGASDTLERPEQAGSARAGGSVAHPLTVRILALLASRARPSRASGLGLPSLNKLSQPAPFDSKVPHVSRQAPPPSASPLPRTSSESGSPLMAAGSVQPAPPLGAAGRSRSPGAPAAKSREPLAAAASKSATPLAASTPPGSNRRESLKPDATKPASPLAASTPPGSNRRESLKPTASKPASPLAASVPAAERSQKSLAPAASKPASAAPASRVAEPLQLIAIGASTGGTIALTEVLRQLPLSSLPVLVVQHMLPEFTSDFAERLNDACALEVREAVDGAALRAGLALIAPGGRNLRVTRDADGCMRACVVDEPPLLLGHRPSVDVLFQSCADVVAAGCIGVLLTGMGDDGARGMLALHNAGGRTFVQDRASSACFGMPSAAIALGAAQRVLALSDIASALIELQVL